jgi:hypothetical protein
VSENEAPRTELFSAREAQIRKFVVMTADEMDRIVADRRLHHDGQPIPYEELLTVACDAVFYREVVPKNLDHASFAYQVTTMYTYRVVSRDPQYAARRKQRMSSYSEIDRTTSRPRSSTK